MYNFVDADIVILANIVDECSVKTFKETIYELLGENIAIADFILVKNCDDNFRETINTRIDTSKIMFIFLSSEFIRDTWPDISNISNINDSFYSDQRQVVPVYLTKSTTSTFGFNSLQGLKFYKRDNNAYITILKSLFQKVGFSRRE